MPLFFLFFLGGGGRHCVIFVGEESHRPPNSEAVRTPMLIGRHLALTQSLPLLTVSLYITLGNRKFNY